MAWRRSRRGKEGEARLSPRESGEGMALRLGANRRGAYVPIFSTSRRPHPPPPASPRFAGRRGALSHSPMRIVASDLPRGKRARSGGGGLANLGFLFWRQFLDFSAFPLHPLRHCGKRGRGSLSMRRMDRFAAVCCAHCGGSSARPTRAFFQVFHSWPFGIPQNHERKIWKICTRLGESEDEPIEIIDSGFGALGMRRGEARASKFFEPPRRGMAL